MFVRRFVTIAFVIVAAVGLWINTSSESRDAVRRMIAGEISRTFASVTSPDRKIRPSVRPSGFGETIQDRNPNLSIKVNDAAFIRGRDEKGYPERVVAVNVTVSRYDEHRADLVDLNLISFHLVIPDGATYTGQGLEEFGHKPCNYDISLGYHGTATCYVYFENKDFYDWHHKITGSIRFDPPGLYDTVVSAPVTVSEDQVAYADRTNPKWWP